MPADSARAARDSGRSVTAPPARPAVSNKNDAIDEWQSQIMKNGGTAAAASACMSSEFATKKATDSSRQALATA